MEPELINATTTIPADPADVFDVLADPAEHAAIDGTGWVRESLDGDRLSEVGQIFRMAMYHANHPDGNYEMANRIVAFDPPRAIGWEPGQRSAETGEVETGGWVWRYDLRPEGTGTEVTLTYDWSAVPAPVRQEIPFPPFGVDHLEHSLQHLREIVAD